MVTKREQPLDPAFARTLGIDCRAMRYKARFLPHERLIGGAWRRFDR